MKGTGREAPQIKVRVPQELMDYLRDQAERNCRSMTAEINFRLLQTKEQEGRVEPCK